jgi:hypothetical protein
VEIGCSLQNKLSKNNNDVIYDNYFAKIFGKVPSPGEVCQLQGSWHTAHLGYSTSILNPSHTVGDSKGQGKKFLQKPQ